MAGAKVKKVFVYSFASRLTESLGAIVGYIILRSFINDEVSGIVFSMAAGIMVFISLDELLPAAREDGGIIYLLMEWQLVW
ncbi:ZIP family metal transporter [Clostridium hominis]|uniref:ZIP family metal transporter n=1 Tax=Clostridium hominis TaxID=2763036 RepID=UPI00344BC601